MPFLYFKNNKEDFAEIKSKKHNKEQTLNYYQSQINMLSQKNLSLQACIDKLVDILNPFLKNKEPLSLKECVNRAFLNKKN